MENNLAIIGTKENLADIMGMSNTVPSSRSALAEIKQVHQNIMGTKEVDGEKMEVAVIKAGSYSVVFPDETVYYSDKITIRTFMQRFQWERWDDNFTRPDGGSGRMLRSVMGKSLSVDLKDNYGGFNCGRPSGYVKDFSSLPQETQDIMKSTKRYKIVFGLCTLDNAKDANGKSVDVKEFPFFMRVKNRDSFKAMNDIFNAIQRKNRLPIQHNLVLSSELKSIPSGATYAVIKASLGSEVEITADDQETLNSFVEWVESMNSITLSKWEENRRPEELSEADEEIVSSIVEIEDE
jgi:TusA-related sulfurtransferase